jgi:Tol biopolymer transport system component
MGMAGSRLGRVARLSLVALAASLALAPAAHATFPGANGKIAFVRSSPNFVNNVTYTVNPDGSGLTQITSGNDVGPVRWRPDGQRIAFARVIDSHVEGWIMNPDGSGQMRFAPTRVEARVSSWSPDAQKIAYHVISGNQCAGEDTGIATSNSDGTGEVFITSQNDMADEQSPAWSPDGARIAFVRLPFTCGPDGEVYYGSSDIWLMNPDGTGKINITNNSNPEVAPDWSPDGTKIVFTCFGICTMNADGSGAANPTDKGFAARWSPDGTKIVFFRNSPTPLENEYQLWIMNPDGSGQTKIADSAHDPDWQPLPTPSYHHPQSASQLNVSLVPAFKPCGTGGNPSNAKHAPPLATNSCNPPKPSLLAAVGSTSQSSAQMTVVPGDTDPTNGNQANVSISASLTDIQSTAGGDYNPNASGPDLTAVTRLRLTDKANGYGGLPATATEYDFKVPIDCSSTPDPSIGSTCSANTTANTLLPGLIQEQRQAVVQAFRVRVDDSGANGIRGDSDDRIFATQGVFIP